MHELCVPRSGLVLTTSFKVAAAGDDESDQNHHKDGRESCAETCPVQVDEREPVIGLVKRDFA